MLRTRTKGASDQNAVLELDRKQAIDEHVAAFRDAEVLPATPCK